MGSATARKPADSLQAQVLAFARRAVTFAAKDDSRPSICCAIRTAPRVWCVTDGNRMAFLPAPADWPDGDLWPIGVCMPVADFATLCAIGVPEYAPEPAIGTHWPMGFHPAFGVGSAAVKAAEYHFPDYRGVTVGGDGYSGMVFDMPAIAALVKAATATIAPTPAEKLATGGKALKVGYSGSRQDTLQLRCTIDGKCSLTVPWRDRDLDDGGVWQGATAETQRTFGDLNDAKPDFAINPRYVLQAFGPDGVVHAHFRDQVSPIFAMHNGEYHVIMPHRM